MSRADRTVVLCLSYLCKDVEPSVPGVVLVLVVERTALNVPMHTNGLNI